MFVVINHFLFLMTCHMNLSFVVIKRREQSLLDQSIIITVYIHAVCAASWLISLEAANHADKGPVVLG